MKMKVPARVKTERKWICCYCGAVIRINVDARLAAHMKMELWPRKKVRCRGSGMSAPVSNDEVVRWKTITC